MKTLADFKPPYSAEFTDHHLFGRILVLADGGKTVNIFSVIGHLGEQGAIDAAWEAAYGPLPTEADNLREANAELLLALKAILRISNPRGTVSFNAISDCARLVIAKAESR